MQSQTHGTPALYRVLLADSGSAIRTARVSLANQRRGYPSHAAVNAPSGGSAVAADTGSMLAKYVGPTVAATGFAVAFAAVFGRRPALLRRLAPPARSANC